MHYIGLVFVNPNDTLEDVLEPFDESNDKYYEFIDLTDEVVSEWNRMPDTLPENAPHYEASKEKYPTIEWLAEQYFYYQTVGDKYGVYRNPNSKWDWWEIGGRWANCLTNKEGKKTDEDYVDEIDWEKTIEKQNFFYYIEVNGEWHDSDAEAINAEQWKKQIKAYIASIKEKDLVVFAVDMHD